MSNIKLWVDDSPYIDEFLESVWDELFEESIIDSVRNTIKKPKIIPSTKCSNQLNLTFKGIKLSIDKKESDEDPEMFLKRAKRDLTWLNKYYDKAVDIAIKEDLLPMAKNWEMPTSVSKIKSLMKLDYVEYTPLKTDTDCVFMLGFNTGEKYRNNDFFHGYTYWIEIGVINGKSELIGYSMYL